MGWRLAKSLETLRSELNAKFPNRDKVSDGTIGDVAHSKRKSSHNPDARGVVRAFDCTNNRTQGIDGFSLLKALIRSKDPRIWYIIFNAHIYNKKDNFQAKPYTGLNSHKHHLHISVSDDPKLYDDASAWNLNFDTPTETIQPRATDTVNQPTRLLPNTLLKRGMRGAAVVILQEALRANGYLAKHEVDGDFGQITETAVKLFQKANKLQSDGIAGANTLTELGLI